MSVRILKQYERGVQFRLGRVTGGARPGLIFIIPVVDRVHRVSLRIITMSIQSQGIITKDNVSVDVSAVAYYLVSDAIRSVVAIENVEAAINQIAQTTLRSVVGRHTLDETLSETDTINQNIREILDVQTEEWGIKVTVVELRDIQLPESMKRAMARRGRPSARSAPRSSPPRVRRSLPVSWLNASDVMMAHPLALQLRNLQTLVEIAVDKKLHVRRVPGPVDEQIQELGAFLNRETSAAADLHVPKVVPSAAPNGSSGQRLTAHQRLVCGRAAPQGAPPDQDVHDRHPGGHDFEELLVPLEPSEGGQPATVLTARSRSSRYSRSLHRLGLVPGSGEHRRDRRR